MIHRVLDGRTRGVGSCELTDWRKCLMSGATSLLGGNLKGGLVEETRTTKVVSQLRRTSKERLCQSILSKVSNSF